MISWTDDVVLEVLQSALWRRHLDDWHDTVVQLQLIRDPEYFPELDTAPELTEIKATLFDQLHERKLQLLGQVRETLAQRKVFTE